MNVRKHLSGREFERLLEAFKGSRNETRDRCLLLLMFRHGLRVSEAWLVMRARMKAPGKPLGRSFFLSEQRKPLYRSSGTCCCTNTARKPSSP